MQIEHQKSKPLYCATVLDRIKNYKREDGRYNPIEDPSVRENVLGAVQRNLGNARTASEEEISNPIFRDNVVAFAAAQIKEDSTHMVGNDELRRQNCSSNRAAIEVLATIGTAKAGLELADVYKRPTQYCDDSRNHALESGYNIQATLMAQGKMLESIAVGSIFSSARLVADKSALA